MTVSMEGSIEGSIAEISISTPLLYSDGVTEATDHQGEELGSERLRRTHEGRVLT